LKCTKSGIRYTEEEDNLLRKYREEKKNFREISRLIGRTTSSVKSRWQVFVNKDRRKENPSRQLYNDFSWMKLAMVQFLLSKTNCEGTTSEMRQHIRKNFSLQINDTGIRLNGQPNWINSLNKCLHSHGCFTKTGRGYQYSSWKLELSHEDFSESKWKQFVNENVPRKKRKKLNLGLARALRKS
jgi:hypothetical protein